MVRRLDATAPGFEEAFADFLAVDRTQDADVAKVVAAILAAVRERGDDALIEYTRAFDGFELEARSLAIERAEVDAAVASVPRETARALERAAARILAFHEKQRPGDQRFCDADGIEIGVRWTPVSAAGLYVPGGKAAYPSSVLMTALPARAAGVERIAMTVPTPGGVLNPLVLAAARIAGIDEIYRLGGAQAVAALAFGTDTIAAVDKIVGPGNVYVAEAKRQVFGIVGLDSIAGPSEILVVADAKNDPRWIAADLLSQAEHDEVAQAILITDDAAFADATSAAIEEHLATLPRADIARASWYNHGAIIVLTKLSEAASLIDRIAPEHLELAVEQPEGLAKRVRHAGAIFLGRYTPEAIGDYVAGPSHVLPTYRTARFSSGLSTIDFMKRTSIIGCGADGVAKVGPDAARLAEAEGLHAHSLSVRLRLEPGEDA